MAGTHGKFLFFLIFKLILRRPAVSNVKCGRGRCVRQKVASSRCKSEYLCQDFRNKLLLN
jgi:hypothetical protein